MISSASEVLLAARETWKKDKQRAEVNNAALEKQYGEDVRDWEEEKRLYELKQEENNKRILEKKHQYHSKEPSVVYDYCELVLANSQYPDYFPQEWDIEFQEEAKILIVDYSLPDMEKLPTVKAVRYVASRDAFTESHLSSAALSKYMTVFCIKLH